MKQDLRCFADIDAERERLGITQKYLCQEADVHESTLSRARLSKREPMPRTRRKLAEALARISARRGVMVVDHLEEGARS